MYFEASAAVERGAFVAWSEEDVSRFLRKLCDK
jgi:hypothetical protein